MDERRVDEEPRPRPIVEAGALPPTALGRRGDLGFETDEPDPDPAAIETAGASGDRGASRALPRPAGGR